MTMAMKNIIKKTSAAKTWGVCCSFSEKFRKISTKLMGVGGEKRASEPNVPKNVLLKTATFPSALLI